jgi:RNA polymerase sigma-70 factor (ECF subfamily)
MAISRSMAEPWQEIRSLYEEHAAFVRRVLLRVGTSASDVDDLLQEVFLVALRKIEGFEGRSKPRTWLCGIALRVAAGARRSSKLRSLIGLDRAPELADPGTPVQALERKETQAQVQRALGKLGEKKRTVFLLFDVEGLSGEEIAEATECPVATVWTRLHHARKDFLHFLKLQQDAAEPRPRLASGGGL